MWCVHDEFVQSCICCNVIHVDSLCLLLQGEGKELMLEDFTPYGTPFGTPLKEEGEDTPPLNQDSFKKRLTFTTDMQQ